VGCCDERRAVVDEELVEHNRGDGKPVHEDGFFDHFPIGMEVTEAE
jgi:hypothetical protein